LGIKSSLRRIIGTWADQGKRNWESKAGNEWNKVIVYAMAGLLGPPVTFLLVKIFVFF